MRRHLVTLTRHWLGLFGAALTTATGVLFVALFAGGLFGTERGPYTGIVTYLVLPALFVLGLILMPIGVWLGRRATPLPLVNFSQGAVRRGVLLFLLATAINVVILGIASYKGIEVMDSVEFCGTACHTVMHPEHAAYQASAHASVPCVRCHIGGGPHSFVKAKLNGSRQALALLFGRYEKPITTAIDELPPASETCERCHSRAQHAGNVLKLRNRFDADEHNTRKTTALRMHLGGTGGSAGIRRHTDPATRIRYRADATGQTIYEVELTEAGGKVKTFLPPAEAGGPAATKTEWRVMDCLDCHNRPAHVFRSAADAVDEAIERGEIGRTLPFIKREALAALEADYPSQERARAEIAGRIRAFYRQTGAVTDAAETAAKAIAEIWCANVFPTMNIRWGTYPSDLGHTDSPGCFRCHDELHKTAEGEVIAQDCALCHALLAVDEENPEILAKLGN